MTITSKQKEIMIKKPGDKKFNSVCTHSSITKQTSKITITILSSQNNVCKLVL